MAKADQFGLWPQSVATLEALLSMQIKSWLPFSNSNPQFKTDRHDMMTFGDHNVAIQYEENTKFLKQVFVAHTECYQSFVADAHRDDGKRFVVHADDKLTAFLETISAFNHYNIVS
jgi:hypothetical protein